MNWTTAPTSSPMNRKRWLCALLAAATLGGGWVLLQRTSSSKPRTLAGPVRLDRRHDEPGNVRWAFRPDPERTQVPEVPPAPSYRPGRGSVAFEVVSADGTPVEGFHLDLNTPQGMDLVKLDYLLDVPPEELYLSRPVLHGETDAHGRFRVDHLLPGDYTWASERGVLLSPRAGGTIPVRTGETSALLIMHGTGTTVVGRLPLPVGVRLMPKACKIRLVNTGTGRVAKDFIPKGVRPQPDGRFVYQCTPGEGRLYAYWREPNGSVFISAQNLLIQEGMNDVGVLPVWPSDPVLLRVEFRRGGRVVPREELFEPGTFGSMLSMHTRNNVRPPGGHGLSYTSLEWLDWTEPVLLHGFFPGNWEVKVGGGEEYPPLLDPRTRLVSRNLDNGFLSDLASAQFVVPEVPPAGAPLFEAVPVYEVLTAVNQEFQIAWGGEVFRARLRLQSVSGEFPPDRAHFMSDASGIVSTPIGEYDYLLTPHHGLGCNVNAQASGVIEITGDGQPIVLTARRGAVLKGKRPTGPPPARIPRPGVVYGDAPAKGFWKLSATLSPWCDEQGVGRSMYLVPNSDADSEGGCWGVDGDSDDVWTLRGIRPDSTLFVSKGRRGRGMVRTGAPGSVTFVP